MRENAPGFGPARVTVVVRSDEREFFVSHSCAKNAHEWGTRIAMQKLSRED